MSDLDRIDGVACKTGEDAHEIRRRAFGSDQTLARSRHAC